MYLILGSFPSPRFARAKKPPSDQIHPSSVIILHACNGPAMMEYIFNHDNSNSLGFFFILLTSCIFHAPAYYPLCMHFTCIMRDATFTVHPSYIFEGCNNYPHLYLRDVIITLHPSYIFEGCNNYFTSLT